jgi:gliding motility-associated-like protein
MRTLFSLLAIFLPSLFFCQTIQVHSVKAARQASGDNGYTLDGYWMGNSRAKLANPANFGPVGIYPKNVFITDDYSDPESLRSVTSLPVNDLFFFGNFEISHTNPFFSGGEIDSLYAWSLRGGKMIIAAGQLYSPSSFDSRVLNFKWGFESISGATSPTATQAVPTPEGLRTDLFHGPFGDVDTVKQGGSIQGYFNTTPSDIKSFATIGTSAGTGVFMDCKTLDLIVIDIDFYTSIGGISQGGTIVNDQDKFWVNTIAFMDKLQSPPVLVKNGTQLSVADNYLAYQWYYNGQLLDSAFTHTIETKGAGVYYVKTTVNGGCTATSSELTLKQEDEGDCEPFVPTAFSPNGDAINDLMLVYGTCIKELDFKMYDRWGELVFESKDQAKGWDGLYKGERANSGTYGWTLKAVLASGNKIERKGSITVVR